MTNVSPNQFRVEGTTTNVLTVRSVGGFVGTIAKTPKGYVVIDAGDRNVGAYESVHSALAALAGTLPQG